MFGEAGVNIANMAVSRTTEGGKALMAFSIDSPAPARARRARRGVRVRRRAVHLAWLRFLSSASAAEAGSRCSSRSWRRSSRSASSDRAGPTSTRTGGSRSSGRCSSPGRRARRRRSPHARSARASRRSRARRGAGQLVERRAVRGRPASRSTRAGSSSSAASRSRSRRGRSSAPAVLARRLGAQGAGRGALPRGDATRRTRTTARGRPLPARPLRLLTSER